ncbi:MAG: hypothetical protein ABI577_01770 [bacterium]
MSTRTKRKRPTVSVGGNSPHATAPAVAGMAPMPMPHWQWRTFPVYFAFSIGGFLGLYMGLIAGATSNSTISIVAFSFWAILLGFGFSRFVSRWMMSKGWARQRTVRKR